MTMRLGYIGGAFERRVARRILVGGRNYRICYETANGVLALMVVRFVRMKIVEWEKIPDGLCDGLWLFLFNGYRGYEMAIDWDSIRTIEEIED